jgi:hypothetical protein
LARPALLQPATWATICQLYQACWVDSPDTALQLVCKWAQQHPEAEPQFTTDMYRPNRREYYVLGYAVTWQYPAHLALLEPNYLVLTDGSCCLPIAYTLAHSYLMKGRIDDWVKRVDERLKDNTLTGDRRVSWLLARAQAEEIRFCGAVGRASPPYQYLAGQGWLEEACLTAASETARLRAYKELAVRLASQEQIDAARKQLDKAAAKASSAASTASLAAWRQDIDQVAAAYAEMHKKQTAAAEQGYWDNLRTRRQQAISVGNQAAVSQYDQIFSDAGIAP